MSPTKTITVHGVPIRVKVSGGRAARRTMRRRFSPGFWQDVARDSALMGGGGAIARLGYGDDPVWKVGLWLAVYLLVQLAIWTIAEWRAVPSSPGVTS